MATPTEILLATIRSDQEDQNDRSRRSVLPAFAEIVFLEQMGTMAKSAVGHFASSLADSAGGSIPLLVLAHNVDLLFSWFSLIAQWHCLEQNDASILETLYGLRRVNIVGESDGKQQSSSSSSGSEEVQMRPMNKHQRLVSLMLLSVAPLFVDVLDDFAKSQRSRSSASSSSVAQDGASRMRNNGTRAGDDETAPTGTGTSASSNDTDSEYNSSSNGSNSDDNGSQRSRLQWFAYAILQWVVKVRLAMRRFAQQAASRAVSGVISISNTSCWLFGRVFPYIKASYRLLTLYQKFLCMFGMSSHADPVLAWLGLSLVKARKVQYVDTGGNAINKSGTMSSSDKSVSAGVGTGSTTEVGINGKNPQSSSFLSRQSSVGERVATGLVAAVVVVKCVEMIIRAEPPQRGSGNRGGVSPLSVWWRRMSRLPRMVSRAVFRAATRRRTGTAIIHNNKEVNGTNAGGDDGDGGGGVEYDVDDDEDYDGDASNSIMANRHTRQILLTIPPPRAPKVGRGCIVPPKDTKMCPICRQKRVHPCASTGGYVFCYRCLLEHVRASATCPVTGLLCGESDILRLYEDESAHH